MKEAADAMIAQIYGFYQAHARGEITIDSRKQNHDIVTLTLGSGCQVIFSQVYFERRRREKRNNK
jgi:hypothetical protein